MKLTLDIKGKQSVYAGIKREKYEYGKEQIEKFKMQK